MGTKRKTPDVLDAMTAHVHHEVSRLALFTHVGNGWLSDVPGLGDGLAAFTAEAMLEAAMIHLRGVVEFLQDQPAADRVSAVDYVPTWEVDDDERMPERDYRQLHHRVAHLGLARGSVSVEGAFDWTVFIRERAPGVLATFRRFLDEVPEPRRGMIRQPSDQQVDLLDVLPPAAP